MDIWASRTPRKQAQLNINVGVLRIGNDPESQHSCGFQGFIRDDSLGLNFLRDSLYSFAFFINSGLVSVVQAGDARKELRDERNDQQTFSSEDTKKKWGLEKGADFMMNGVITSIVDQYGKNKVVYYQIDLELTNLETNEKVWIGDKKIKKAIKN